LNSSEHGVVTDDPQAVKDDLVEFVPIDRQAERPTEPHIAQQSSPGRIVDRQIGNQRGIGAAGRLPQANPISIARLAFLEERVVVESEIARLQIGFAGARLQWHDLVVGDQHDDFVDVGQLPAGRVDAVIVRVAPEHEAIGRRSGRQHPGLQRRQVRVVVLILIVGSVVQHHPVAYPRLFHLGFELGLGRVLGVKFLQIVGGTEDRERPGAGQSVEKTGVPARPRVANGRLGQNLEGRPFAVDQHLRRQAGGLQARMIEHVVPVVFEIRRGQRLPVRPTVPATEVKRVPALVLDLDAFGDVRSQLKIRGVADQTRIAVHDHHAHVFARTHDHVHLAAVLT
jgi:hypothetical protein